MVAVPAQQWQCSTQDRVCQEHLMINIPQVAWPTVWAPHPNLNPLIPFHISQLTANQPFQLIQAA